MQNWTRLYDYIHEYQTLIYDFYAKHSVAFLTTYYNIDKNITVWDDTDLLGGSYEKLGDLSGIKWNKYLLIPVYFIDEVSTAFDASETGLIKENETSIVIPDIYGITPYANDLVKFEQEFLRPNNDTYPIYSVQGIEVTTNADRRFWKLKLTSEQSKTILDVEEQVQNTFTFFDYDKNIHTVSDAEMLTKLMVKNETVKDGLKEKHDGNSGFYFV